MHSPLLATVTHARLRVAQGDVAAAREILHELLLREPDNSEARSLLEALIDCVARPPDAPADRRPRPRQPGDPRALAREFEILREGRDAPRVKKIRRLRDWASRIGAGESADTPPGE